MQLKTLLLKSVALGLLLGALSGCTSPGSQRLDLRPDITVSHQLKPTIAVEIQPQDLRSSKLIGYRYSGHPPYPEIHLKDSLHLLKHSTKQALGSMGISQFHPGEFRMTVSLIELSYQVDKAVLKQVVDLTMKLRVEVRKGEKSSEYVEHASPPHPQHLPQASQGPSGHVNPPLSPKKRTLRKDSRSHKTR